MVSPPAYPLVEVLESGFFRRGSFIVPWVGSKFKSPVFAQSLLSVVPSKAPLKPLASFVQAIPVSSRTYFN